MSVPLRTVIAWSRTRRSSASAEEQSWIRRRLRSAFPAPSIPTSAPRLHPPLSPKVPRTAARRPPQGWPRTGPRPPARFKVYSPEATDWTVGIDLRVTPDGLALTTPSGHHDFAADRFTVEMSPDGMFVWILGDRLDRPAVTVLMPASLEDLQSRVPGVEFTDLDEAAHVIRRLTAAGAAGRHTKHRFGLDRSGDMGLVINPLEGEPVLALLRIVDRGMEFRTDGVWEADSPAKRIPPFTSLIPVTRGVVARFDHLERSPSMSLSLFRRFVIPAELPSSPASARSGAASDAPRACTAPGPAPASAGSTTSGRR